MIGVQQIRYTIEAYTFRGVERFRILDTFNGCKVLDKSATIDAATTRREQLNALQACQRCEGDSQCKKSPVRGSKFCADHIAFSDDQETK